MRSDALKMTLINLRHLINLISLKIKVQFRLPTFETVHKLLIFNKISGNLYKVTTGYQDDFKIK